MRLQKEDVELFYKLNWALLFYVNQKHQIIKWLKEPILAHENPEHVLKLQEKLYARPELIDSFVAENPFKFASEELGIIKSWKNFMKGGFFIVAYLKDYAVFLCSKDDEPVAYGVLGIYDEIQDVAGPVTPRYVDTVLLPFKGKIIYGGIMQPYAVHFGGGVTGTLKTDYEKAKSKYGIVTSLDAPAVERKESDEELLKFYARSEANRAEYEDEIQKLLKKDFRLLKIYSLEIGKSSARKIAKRLSEIGAAPAWFAVFEDTIIASGPSEQEARKRANEMLPEGKRDGLYVFRWKGQ